MFLGALQRAVLSVCGVRLTQLVRFCAVPDCLVPASNPRLTQRLARQCTE